MVWVNLQNTVLSVSICCVRYVEFVIFVLVIIIRAVAIFRMMKLETSSFHNPQPACRASDWG